MPRKRSVVAGRRREPARASLPKAPTGISGFDEITLGGLPKGRPTLVCGGPGCGKTMFAMEFLARGASQFNEPGVLMTFEETGEEMTRNIASLGFDLDKLKSSGKIFLDYVRVEPSEIQETGEYDLEGLFIRLQHAVDSIGAKRVVLDTLEAIFSGFSNAGMLRAEIRRLFRWLKDRNLTTVVTAERGDGALTRYGLEEYVSDCVISLDNRVSEQISTRRMRIVKYRGSAHGADEYPFLIGEEGFSVIPLTSLKLEHKVSNERISSGVGDLDEMMEGRGFYRGTSILVSGTAGSGKSSLAAHFADKTCRDRRRCLYIGFEESAEQAIRNMRSISLNLGKHIKNGLLRFEAWRPTQHGLEMHLLRIHKLVEEFNPEVVIIDPVTTLMVGDQTDVHAMLMRLIDFLKGRQITAMFTTLTADRDAQEKTEVGISSLSDTWILLRDLEFNGERNRCIYVMKSRGMAHSNQIREFLLTSNGVHLTPAYLGEGTVLTGSARLAQEAAERDAALKQRLDLQETRSQWQAKRRALEVQMEALRADLSNGRAQLKRLNREAQLREQVTLEDRVNMSKNRRVSSAGTSRKASGKDA